MSSLSDRLAAARRPVLDPEPAPAPEIYVPGGDVAIQGERPQPTVSPDIIAAEAVAQSVNTPGKRRANVPGNPDSLTARTASAMSGGTAAPSGAFDGGLARRSVGQAHDRIEELKSNVHIELLKQLGPHLYDSDMDQQELDTRVRGVLADVLGTQERPLSSSDRARVTQEISDDILGYGPIEPFLRDPDVSEVMVNGYDSVWLEKGGKLMPADASFTDEAHLRRTIDKIVSRIGRRVDESSPMVDARLPDGSRVNAVVPPLAVDGSALTIRKFAADPLTVNDLINFGSLSPTTAAFLDACVRGRLNIFVSGSTGAGKTTTLNVLSSFIPGDERIVTIEDAAELQLKQDHVVRLESRPANIEGKGAVSIRDLVRNSLRMRPDRIIVGEVRDASALDMLQAMNTGHDGSICTLHSNGPRDTLSRMETMVLMAGMDLPMKAIREQVASAVDMIVHQTRFRDGSRRITHITEVERMEGDVITLQDIFLWDSSAGFDSEGRTLGRMRATGLRPKFLDKMGDNNVTVDPSSSQRTTTDEPPHGCDSSPSNAGSRFVTATLGIMICLGLVVVGGPATAADQPGSIAHVEATDSGLQILVSVPPDSQLDLSDLDVSIGGSPAIATATKVDDTTTVRRTTILVIDTSNSMKGARFTAARAAAKRFIRTVPRDVYVGIVGFAADVTTLLPPTQDRNAAKQVLGNLDLSLNTSLYDGVIQAAGEAGDEGQRTLLVLSDGSDTSETPLADAVSAITDNDLTVDVVALDQGAATAPGLDELASAGGGQVIPADPDAVQKAFATEAQTLADQVLVTAQVPDAVSAAGTTEANVSVVLHGAAGDVSATAFSPLGDVAPPSGPDLKAPSASNGMVIPAWVEYAGPAALGLGLLVLLALLVPSAPAPLTAEQRVSRYTAVKTRVGAGEPSGRLEADQMVNQARDVAADLLLRNKGLEARISVRLEAAGSELRSAEWLLVHGGVFVASGLLGLVISRGNLVIGILFLVVGFFGPWMYLGFRRGRRRKMFNRGLPDTLQLMSGSLSAGLSLAQSVDTIVREGPEPIAGEFKRVLVETRLGVSLEDAMDGISERFESKDFEWVVMAIRIQRQVGGNLAELLDTVAATMREREYIRRQVAALAAEGKLSAWVLGLLPPLFLCYLMLANRTYVMVLFTEPLGWLMLAGAGVLLSVGVFWMSRLIKVEV